MKNNLVTTRNSGYQPFGSELWETLEKQIDAITRAEKNPIAAFDIDGTIWDGDIAERFFEYQVLHRLLPNLPRDPWAHYYNLVAEDEEKGFMWLAQTNAGFPVETVRKWAKEAFMANLHSMPFFEDQQKLITRLLQKNFNVYFISGSPLWAIEPIVEYLGGKTIHALGMSTRVENGIITAEPVFPLTWKAGKIEALLKATNGKNPNLAAGNTMGDFALINAATHIKLAVTSQPRQGRLITSEHQLQREATARQWLTHSFANVE